LASGRVDAAIEGAIAYFEGRGVPAFSWRLMPDMQPADLGEVLESHGFELREGSAGMAIDLERVGQDANTPAGMRIEIVRDERAFRRWNSVAATWFGMADYEAYLYDWWRELGFDLPLRYYLGLLDTKPVAISSFFLDGDVAGIYCVGVLSDVRKRSIGTAMMRPPLRDARALGNRVGILHALEMGYNLYRRLGFQETCRMSHYVWKREQDATRPTAQAR
jgi:ribosomal protein S18 acetylase RimI-like enzyme